MSLTMGFQALGSGNILYLFLLPFEEMTPFVLVSVQIEISSGNSPRQAIAEGHLLGFTRPRTSLLGDSYLDTNCACK